MSRAISILLSNRSSLLNTRCSSIRGKGIASTSRYNNINVFHERAQNHTSNNDIIMVNYFWSSASSIQDAIAKKIKNMRKAEQDLLSLAQMEFQDHRQQLQYQNHQNLQHTYDIQVFDTSIPKSSVPVINKGMCSSSTYQNILGEKEDEFIIHGVKVKSSSPSSSTTTTTSSKSTKTTTDVPLVIVHGYMNAATFFYRNLLGLSTYFDSVYSLDLLGYGLSSRPRFDHLMNGNKKNDVSYLRSAEDFFVESLEQWREKNNIKKMILAGHSKGGYISVAYCEKYPQHVDHLVLLSPVGVPDPNTDVSFQRRLERWQSSFRGRAFMSIFQTLFDMAPVGSFLRTMPEERSYGLVESYVDRRLPTIVDKEEKRLVTDYIYYNCVLPGSGEYAVNAFLNSFIMAREPLQNRIPLLKVPKVTFLYGDHDWMDVSGGLASQQLSQEKSRQQQQQERQQHTVGDSFASTSSSSAPPPPPNVNVFVVPNAGHLLHIDNWKMTNATMIHACGGPVPISMRLSPLSLLYPNDDDQPSQQPTIN